MAVPAVGLASHYQILGLTPTLVDSQHDPSKLIKRAYHRALLRNHPDKAGAKAQPASEQPQSSSTSHSYYTVDQISTAFGVLSSPRQRAAYDAVLRTSRGSLIAGDSGSSAAATGAQLFQTGVENVDLDDLPFDEDDGAWYRSCRCGNDRGYLFREDDLEEAADEGELMVGCLDCSLWLRVHFAVLDDEPSIAAEHITNNDTKT
jgi:curved DNA-binding protein CbpA